MFSGISCLFCVNYEHSVMSQLRREGIVNPAPPKIEIALKRLVFGCWLMVVAMWYIHHNSILNRKFRFGNGDFDLDVWNSWVYTA
jgi:hypothetical protein